jgi:hypothetical protein
VGGATTQVIVTQPSYDQEALLRRIEALEKEVKKKGVDPAT